MSLALLTAGYEMLNSAVIKNLNQIEAFKLKRNKMKDERGNIPTIVVTDKDNYIILVGHAEFVKSSTLGRYARKGYTIKTMTFDEYLRLRLTWIWDKPSAVESPKASGGDETSAIC